MDKPPFKHCVVNGNILAEDGNKMSKSKGNYTDPNKLLDEFGADAFRFYLMSTPVMKAQDMNFSDDGLREVNRKLLNILSNVNRFYDLFATQNKILDDDSSTNILDKWILSKTHKLIKEATITLDDYNTVKVCAEIINFVDVLSTWYVRRSRDRLKSSNEKEKEAAIHTLAFALDNLSKVMAPITPFIAEEIYQSLRKENFEGKSSVHLEKWPKYDDKKIDIKLEEEMDAVREIVSKGLDERIKVKIAVKQPLAKVIVVTPSEIRDELKQPILDELNVKEVEVKKGEEVSAVLDVKMTPQLEREGASREIIRKVNDLRKKTGLTIEDRIDLFVETDSDMIKKAVEEFEEDISHSVQANKIHFEKNDGTEFIIKDQKVKLDIKK